MRLMLLTTALAALSFQATALTFHKDGSIVQKDGTVTTKSFADRFEQQFFLDPAEEWPYAKGHSTDPNGFLGEKIFVPGTPLLAIQKIQKGDDYVVALLEKNGFADKGSLQRYIVANANPSFLKQLELTPTEAASYVGSVDLQALAAESSEYSDRLDDMLAKVENAVAESVERVIEDSVSDAVESAVDDAIESAMDDWWAGYIQDLVESGATILEQTSDSVTFTYD